jgi:hypothetical protein
MRLVTDDVFTHVGMTIFSRLSLENAAVQSVYGAEVNVDEDDGRTSDMRSSQSHHDPHKLHLMPDSISGNTRHGVNRAQSYFSGLPAIGSHRCLPHVS